MSKDDTVIKFSTAKKAVKKSRKEKLAAENRVKFGRTKAQKSQDAQSEKKRTSHIDGHKLDKD